MPLTSVSPATSVIGTTPETVLTFGSASQPEVQTGFAIAVTVTLAEVLSWPSEATSGSRWRRNRGCPSQRRSESASGDRMPPGSQLDQCLMWETITPYQCEGGSPQV